MSTLTRSWCGPRRNQRRFALSEMPRRGWTSEYVPLRVAASQFCPASQAALTTGQLWPANAHAEVVLTVQEREFFALAGRRSG
jgi:hypothetical protein